MSVAYRNYYRFLTEFKLLIISSLVNDDADLTVVDSLNSTSGLWDALKKSGGRSQKYKKYRNAEEKRVLYLRRVHFEQAEDKSHVFACSMLF
jgi:hypothetical protein